jgi:ribosomal-protein-serine acetyltransferase
VFSKDLGAGLSLSLLEERHATELSLLIDHNRTHLRQWMPWLDWNTSEADSRAFIAGGCDWLTLHQHQLKKN